MTLQTLDYVEGFVRQLLSDEMVGERIGTASHDVSASSAALFDFHDIEAICRFSPAHHEWSVRLSFFGKKLDRASYLDRRGFYDFPRIEEFHRGGATVIANQAHLYSGRVYNLKRRLERQLHCYVGFNCYATPTNSQGFARHVDSHDVLIVQLAGHKHWELFERAPVVDGHYTMDGFEQDEPSTQSTLSPGDVLYLPEGFVHSARSVERSGSIHLTGGFTPPSLHNLVAAWLDIAAKTDRTLTSMVPSAKLRTDAEGTEFQGLGQKALSLIAETPIAEARRWIADGGLTDLRPEVKTADVDLSFISLTPETALCRSPQAKGHSIPGAFLLRDLANGRTLKLKPELADVWSEIQQLPTFRPEDLANGIEAGKESLFCYYLVSNGFLLRADSPDALQSVAL